MILDKQDLQRAFDRFDQPEPAFERLVGRRHRRERRHRIEAGVTAVVVMLALAGLVARPFGSTAPEGEGSSPALQAPKPGIYIVDPVSGTIRFVWGPSWLDEKYDPYGSWIGAPTLSPNGDRIAFAGRRNGSPFQLWTVSSTGEDLQQVTDCPKDPPCPLGAGSGMWERWSPDGRSIAFMGGPNSQGNPGDIYAVNADGADPRKLVSMPGEEDVADWSPDGTQVAFDHTSFDHPKEQIYTVSLNGGTPALLVHDGGSPLWSPDGRWIAYSRPAGIDGGGSIWLVHPDGTDAHQLLDGMWPVGWSPDGSRLVVLRSEARSVPGSAARRYAVVDVRTGDVQTIEVGALDTAQVAFRWPARS
jgi:WD40 repeat protein